MTDETQPTETRLHYFEGGPLAGRAMTLTEMIVSGRDAPPVHEYVWTRRTVVGTVSGRTARVWKHRDLPLTAEDVETPRVVGTAGGHQGRGTRQVSEPSNETVRTADGRTGAQLRETRETLGLSRPQVAKEAGFTVAQIGNMETSGKRPKPGLMDAVAKVLDAHRKVEAPATTSQSTSEVAPDGSEPGSEGD